MNGPVGRVRAFLRQWDRHWALGRVRGPIRSLDTEDGGKVELFASDLRMIMHNDMLGPVLIGPWSDGGLVGSNDAELTIALCDECAAKLGGRAKPVHWNTDRPCANCGEDGRYFEVLLASKEES